MASITYITPSGERVVVEQAAGTLMTAAVDNQVDGIDGDCGGVCSCATCHIHIDPAWAEQIGLADDIEMGMLELEDDVKPTSRLGCQIPITPELDGLVVHVVGR